jgi:hypothetical protein
MIGFEMFSKCKNLVNNVVGYDAPFNSYNQRKWITKNTFKLSLNLPSRKMIHKEEDDTQGAYNAQAMVVHLLGFQKS